MVVDTPFTRRRTLSIVLAAIAVVFILWNVPQVSGVLYPIRLFVTFVHEAGHGLTAILTGGRFDHFVVYPDGSGVAQTAGGNRLLILPAGYLGAALFGAVLFYLTNTLPYSRMISRLLGLALIVISLLYAGLASLVFSIAPVIGILSGLALFTLGAKGSRDLNILALNILAMMTGLNAVFDLLFLMDNSSASIGSVRNDAQAFSDALTPWLPGSFWALLWALLAALMLGAAVYWSILHPLRPKDE